MESKLSYLMFADDLFLLSTATENSFSVFKAALVEFGEMSGLKPNLQKSNVFLSCVSDDMAQRLCSIVEMPRGSLPVRYLGLPLISTKLGYHDCQPIFSKTK